jgi:hypothetical protein
MKHALAIALSLVVGTIAAVGLNPATAAATQYLSGPCNTSQYLDNSFSFREGDTGTNGPWITNITGTINRYVYQLCSENPPGNNPIVSGSGAWVSINGPGGDDIVQIGYWECGYAAVCGNQMDTNQLDFFCAYGTTGNLLYQPWPTKISLADSASSHVFTVSVHSGSYWNLNIDGTTVVVIPDSSWRTWNRSRVQAADEDYNCGDQLGGRTADGTDPGNHQKFRSISWQAGSTIYPGDLGTPQVSGAPAPWATAVAINGSTSDFDVWTYNHTQSACSG